MQHVNRNNRKRGLEFDIYFCVLLTDAILPTMSHHLPHLPPDTAKFNFAPASTRDSLVHGSFRPGFSEATEKPDSVEDADVAEWAKHLQENGIKRVICLLKDEEVKYYK